MTIFGRDSLIASHQLLMVNTRPARDALELLAARQGTEVNDWRDEQPGKILHEVRDGELARAGIIPHSPYYGSVDSTPWFLIVYAQHLRWTGDVGFARKLLPNAEAALAWIDRYGDLDGDGFVEYLCRSPRGIRNQGWKDSHDSIVHADGRLAEPPIALSEVQGYVYLAKTRMADVYRALGRPEDATRLEDEAERLKVRFNEAFWMEDERYFAAALDADKQPVRTRDVEPRPRPVLRDRRRGQGAAAREAAARARHVLGLGRPDDEPVGGRLQPDELPQRFGLAARQRADRGRAEAVPVRPLDQPRRDGAVRRGDRGRLPPAARAVLRVHAAVRRTAP